VQQPAKQQRADRETQAQSKSLHRTLPEKGCSGSRGRGKNEAYGDTDPADPDDDEHRQHGLPQNGHPPQENRYPERDECCTKRPQRGNLQPLVLDEDVRREKEQSETEPQHTDPNGSHGKREPRAISRLSDEVPLAHHGLAFDVVAECIQWQAEPIVSVSSPCRTGAISYRLPGAAWYNASMVVRRATILDGGLDDALDTTKAREIVKETLRSGGWEVETYRPAVLNIAPCQGCFDCWIRTPGVCVLDDAGRDIARSVIRSDLAVLVTPVTFGGYSSALKRAVDRWIPLILPYFTFVGSEIHHIRRYDRYPRLLGIGLLERENPAYESTFARLVYRNAINLHAPSVEAGVIVVGAPSERDDIVALLTEVTE